MSETYKLMYTAVVPIIARYPEREIAAAAHVVFVGVPSRLRPAAHARPPVPVGSRPAGGAPLLSPALLCVAL